MSAYKSHRDELLVFIRRYFRDHGKGPTFNEMLEALGVASKSGVHNHIAALYRAGLLRKTDSWDRRYEPTDIVVVTYLIPAFLENEVAAAVTAVLQRHPAATLIVHVPVKLGSQASEKAA